MRVVRAEAMGMCFGVKDALAVSRTIANPQDVTIYGELVHNEHVAESLKKSGFATCCEVGRVAPETSSVMITAHGVSNRERTALIEAGKKVIDTTCPLVRRAHDAALKLSDEGWHVVIAGKHNHVEVVGLSGDLASYSVVESPEECVPLPFGRIGVICQTTLQPSAAMSIYEALKKKNPAADIKMIDTICRPTRDRQAAMAKLLPQCDAVVVIGGAHSNNTRQLVRAAEVAGTPVIHVQTARQVSRAWARQFNTIGVTAGTSTPNVLIDEVCNWIEQITPDSSIVAGASVEVA